jgi:hypothetical protein
MQNAVQAAAQPTTHTSSSGCTMKHCSSIHYLPVHYSTGALQYYQQHPPMMPQRSFTLPAIVHLQCLDDLLVALPQEELHVAVHVLVPQVRHLMGADTNTTLPQCIHHGCVLIVQATQNHSASSMHRSKLLIHQHNANAYSSTTHCNAYMNQKTHLHPDAGSNAALHCSATWLLRAFTVTPGATSCSAGRAFSR